MDTCQHLHCLHQATDARATRFRPFSVDDQSVATTSHTATDHLSAHDASVTPSSWRSSRHSPSVNTHLSADDVSVVSSERFQRSHGEPSDAEISSSSDKGFKPDDFDPDDADVKSGDRPSTSNSTNSRSDRTPSKFR